MEYKANRNTFMQIKIGFGRTGRPKTLTIILNIKRVRYMNA